MRRLALFLIAVAGCFSADSGKGGEDACTPGDQKACDCPGGGSGVQICADDGSGFETCQCGGDTDGTTSTTGDSASAGTTTSSSSGPGTSTTTSASTSGSSSSTTDGTGSGTTGAGTCGDGNVDAGEECDDGPNNATDAACTPDCTVAVCGDGYLGPGEQCDEGPDNNTKIGGCRGDCAGTVEVRKIQSSAGTSQGGFGAQSLDLLCDPGMLAMVTDGSKRVASVTANAGDGQVGWVLAPYTAYANQADQLIWITGSEALLGVDDGTTADLFAEIAPDVGGVIQAWTGLEADWTSSVSNCNGWSGTGGTGRIGQLGDATADAWSILARPCNEQHKVLCVQQ